MFFFTTSNSMETWLPVLKVKKSSTFGVFFFPKKAILEQKPPLLVFFFSKSSTFGYKNLKNLHIECFFFFFLKKTTTFFYKNLKISQFWFFFWLLEVKNSKTEKVHKIWKIGLFKTKKLHFWKYLVFDSLTPKSQKNKNWLRKISQKWPKRSKSKKFMKKSKKHHNYTIFLA